MVAIDGCQVGCAKAILEQAQVPLKNYIVLTQEGIEKNKHLKLSRSDIDRVKSAVKKAIGGPPSAPGDSGAPVQSRCSCRSN